MIGHFKRLLIAFAIVGMMFLLMNAGTHMVAGWIQAGNINSILYVDGINYTNISACIAALPSNGGTCVLPPNYTETLVAALLLGNGSTQSVILSAPNGARLTCAMTAVECIGLYNQSGLIGGSGMWSIGSNPNRQNAFVIVDNSSLNVTNMIQNMTTPQASLTLDRVWVERNNSGTVSGYCVDIEGLGNGVIFRDSVLDCNGVGGWEINGNNGFTGPMDVQNVWAYGDGTGNSQPCHIGNNASNPNSVVGIRVIGGACLHPGPNLAGLAIDGTNSSVACQIRGLDITTYIELYGSVNPAAASGPVNTSGILIKNACDVNVRGGGIASAGSGPGGAGTGINSVTINQTGAGLTRAIVLDAFNAFQPTGGNCINNVITGQAFSAGCNFTRYSYTGDSALTPVIQEGGGTTQFFDASGNGELSFNGGAASSDLNWTIQGSITQPGTAFASLGTPAVGSMQFCTNCVATTPASCSTATPASCVCTSGTGSMWAKRENFQNNGLNWYCH